MNKKQRLYQIIVFTIPILILIGLVIPPTMTSINGEEIRLKTKPVDPTDLFRGSYVALSYDIETVLPSQLSDSIRKEINNKYEGDFVNVYVQLIKGSDKIYTIKKIVTKKPDNGIYLKGKLQVPYEGELIDQSKKSYFIQYNLNNYYTPEKIAKKIEATTTVKPAIAIVKVKNGNAVLMDVEIP